MSTIALRLPRSRGTASMSWPYVALALLIAASMMPVALVEIPAMMDYPNHLTRMSILARDGTPDANPFYETAWALYPNLAMDIVVPPLGRLIGVLLATKLFYMAGQALIISGAMALAAARGRRTVVSGVAACLVLYSVPFAWGFVNFEFALGLALWGIAVRLWLRHGSPASFVLHWLFVGLLFVSHLFALGIYGFTIAVIETLRLVRAKQPISRIAANLASLAAPALCMGAMMLLTDGEVGGDAFQWGLAYKPMWLFFLNGWSREASIVLTVPLFALGYVGLRKGWVRFEGDGGWLAIAYGLLFVAMPFKVFDTACADVRVLVGASLILPAFLVVQFPSGLPHRAASVALALVVAGNLAMSAWVQASYLPDYRAMVASFARLSPASHIIIADAGTAEDGARNLLSFPMHHAATLAAHYANAELPQIFAYPGKQPLVRKRDFAPDDVPECGPIRIDLLARIARGDFRPEDPAFLNRWQLRTDYLYLLGPKIANPLPDVLRPMGSSGRFEMFEVIKPPRPLGGP